MGYHGLHVEAAYVPECVVDDVGAIQVDFTGLFILSFVDRCCWPPHRATPIHQWHPLGKHSICCLVDHFLHLACTLAPITAWQVQHLLGTMAKFAILGTVTTK